MTDRELMQMRLDTLEKLADETPTTHVRVGKAKTIDGKEIVALWFDDCSDPIQQAMYINATKPAKLKEFLKQVRDRLAQPEPEPVVWFIQYEYGHDFLWREPAPYERNNALEIKPLYAAPVHAIDISQERVDETTKRKHEWVGLTDEDIKEIDTEPYWDSVIIDTEGIGDLARQIEAKLKEKNNG